MSTSHFTESVVEESGLDLLDELGYTTLHGPDLALTIINTHGNTY